MPKGAQKRSIGAFRPGYLPAVVSLLIAIYGLGEGIGSGLFPLNPPETPFTVAARWHEIFSGIGDSALILVPVMLLRGYPERSGLRRYLILVTGIGLTMVLLFLLAKWGATDNFILSHKGVWQRVYVANYHIMLLVVSQLMIHR